MGCCFSSEDEPDGQVSLMFLCVFTVSCDCHRNFQSSYFLFHGSYLWLSVVFFHVFSFNPRDCSQTCTLWSKIVPTYMNKNGTSITCMIVFVFPKVRTWWLKLIWLGCCCWYRQIIPFSVVTIFFFGNKENS